MSRLGQIKQTFKSVRIEIKAFLRRQQWKEALIFFCFILLAFGFWLLQSLQQEYEIDIRIPVKYKNVPPDISFTETPPEAITVKVKDKGSVLLNYSFGRSFAPIEANMKTQSEKSGKLIINRKDIENEIKKHLIATTSLLSFEPQHIDAVYSKRIKKEIPAVFEGVVQTNAGFKVSGDISITPRSINVYASDVVLDTLKEIKTIYTEIKKRKQDRHTYRPTGKNRRGYSRTDKCNRYDPDRRVYRKNAGNTCYLHQSAAPLHPAHVPGCRESELQRPSFALQGRLGR